MTRTQTRPGTRTDATSQDTGLPSTTDELRRIRTLERDGRALARRHFADAVEAWANEPESMERALRDVAARVAHGNAPEHFKRGYEAAAALLLDTL